MKKFDMLRTYLAGVYGFLSEADRSQILSMINADLGIPATPSAFEWKRQGGLSFLLPNRHFSTWAIDREELEVKVDTKVESGCVTKTVRVGEDASSPVEASSTTGPNPETAEVHGAETLARLRAVMLWLGLPSGPNRHPEAMAIAKEGIKNRVKADSWEATRKAIMGAGFPSVPDDIVRFSEWVDSLATSQINPVTKAIKSATGAKRTPELLERLKMLIGELGITGFPSEAYRTKPYGPLPPDGEGRYKAGLGGSDLASVTGLGYSDAIKLWLEFMGKIPREESTEVMEQGKFMEAFTARRFTEILPEMEVINQRNVRYHREHPWAFYHMDRKIKGLKALLECKYVGPNTKKDWGFSDNINLNDKIPPYVAVQVHWGLAVTGYEVAYVAATFHGHTQVYKVDKNPEIEECLLLIAADFLEKVRSQTAPQPTTMEALSVLSRFVWGDGDPEPIVVSPEIEEAHKELVSLQPDLVRMNKRDQVLRKEMRAASNGHLVMTTKKGEVIANLRKSRSGLSLYPVLPKKDKEQSA